MLGRLSTDQTDLRLCFGEGQIACGNLLKLRPEERTLAQSLFQRLWQETGESGYGAELMGTSLLTELLVLINRLAAQKGSRTAASTSRAVSQVVDYINLHYGEPLSLSMLADRFYVSKYHLSHEFNRQIGTSVHRYILKKRLLISRQMLAQGKAPGIIARDCGFGDYTGFYRAFRGEYGLSPREYMQSARQKAAENGEAGVRN